MLGTLLATILGGAIVGEINRRRAPEPKGVIGSGTAPSLDSGIPLELTDIAGSVVTDPEDNVSDESGKTISDLDEEKLLELLKNNPDGIMGLYHGGKIPNYADGGGILGLGLFDNLDTVVDLENFYNSQSEEVQDIIDSSLAEGILAMIKQYDEPQGSLVSTRTLPVAGNANRRRLQFKPIGMDDGGVLDRKMFKPMLSGGELDGPGGPKDDLIPVMASDGEFMLSKATVDLVGGGNHNKGIAALEKLNNRGNRVYG
tara:strand:- start:182 stop:952 length:771 start_codon:yes stop_codon:yes gene_type:complete